MGGYFGRRLAVVALVLLLFLLGVVTGAVSVRDMEQSQVDEVAAYLETFFQGFQSQDPAECSFQDSVLATTKTLFVILLAGLSAYGIIAIPLVVFSEVLWWASLWAFWFTKWQSGLFRAGGCSAPESSADPRYFNGGRRLFRLRPHPVADRFRIRCTLQLLGHLILTICAWFVALVGSAVEAYLTPLLVGLFSGKLF